MRLWHKDLIPVLPRQQLLSQWRECCCIASNIAVSGTPNHLLVNKIMNYTVNHFVSYTELVLAEMKSRGYKINANSLYKFYNNLYIGQEHFLPSEDNLGISKSMIYLDWHNARYFWQCYHNLEEKYDCGGISEEEWREVNNARRSSI